MIENLEKIIEKFNLKLISSYRGRGAYICETNKGVKLLKVLETTVNRMWFEYYIKQHLIENGFLSVDQFITIDNIPFLEENDKKYVLKNWCNGRECNLFDEDEIFAAIENLAKLHKVLRYIKFPEIINKYNNLGGLPTNFKRHSKELKKVRKYIRNQSRWTEFDILFLKNYNYYYEKSKKSINGIDKSNYYNLVKKAKEQNHVCHGQYTQHNILLTNDDMITVNFERSCLDVQMLDLYHFIRKVMEKNDWNCILGIHIIEKYNQYNTIGKDDLNLLYYLLMYPEKFWKISNYFFNTRKAWKPKRSLSKLEKIIEQKQNKEDFLKSLKIEI